MSFSFQKRRRKKNSSEKSFKRIVFNKWLVIAFKWINKILPLPFWWLSISSILKTVFTAPVTTATINAACHLLQCTHLMVYVKSFTILLMWINQFKWFEASTGTEKKVNVYESLDCEKLHTKKSQPHAVGVFLFCFLYAILSQRIYMKIQPLFFALLFCTISMNSFPVLYKCFFSFTRSEFRFCLHQHLYVAVCCAFHFELINCTFKGNP